MRATRHELEALIPPLHELRRRALAMEQSFGHELSSVHPEHAPSARNLLHYLALRQSDLRPLQRDLAAVGLSSLGRMEAHALQTLDAVLWAVQSLTGGHVPPLGDLEAPCDFVTGPDRLVSNARALLGREPFRRGVRIMVTMPSEAATDPALVRDLLSSGMDVMRINCAHDDADAWRAMIANLRAAERAVGRSCKVYADLPGPKLRTGRLGGGVRVVRFRVRRDARGEVLESPRAWFTPSRRREVPPPGVAGTIPFDGDVLRGAAVGDELAVEDARGKERRFRILALHDGSCIAATRRSAYVETGAAVVLRRGKKALAEGRVAELPEVLAPLSLYVGDPLVLTSEDVAARPVRREGGRAVEPARVHCTLPEVFEQVRPNQAVWFDDGKLGGTIESVDGSEMHVRITETDPRGGKLGAEKGINLPDTELEIPALTAADLEHLGQLAGAVDVVGLSFVRRPEDVEHLHEELTRLGMRQTGIVLKIENRAAFERLPRILLTALRFPHVGVMVARGDLAVEVGFERLSEVQEEILWICEAAHVPVVWATQVLEGLAKTGRPSRAEVTDAAMGVRAECVMLNKGPYVVRTVDFLAGVLDRMHGHQSKKRAMLRPLSVSRLMPSA